MTLLYCQRCGMVRQPRTPITVERDDGQQLTINTRDPCRKALTGRP